LANYFLILNTVAILIHW